MTTTNVANENDSHGYPGIGDAICLSIPLMTVFKMATPITAENRR